MFKIFKKNKHINSGKVAVVYYVPQNTKKYYSWTDGFTSAVKLLQVQFGITCDFINISVRNPSVDELNSYTFLIIKSNWDWYPDKYIRGVGKKLRVPCGLMISGSLPPPSVSSMSFYEVLWYETNWYRKFINGHKNCIHAFGIDTNLARVISGVEKVYDWVSVGMIVPYKNHNNIINKHGRKVVVGERVVGVSEPIIKELTDSDVEVVEYLDYTDYIMLLNKCKNILISCELQGGGERAALESRACGVNVFVEPCNEKLDELLTGEIYDHNYYGLKLYEGISKYFHE